LYVVHGRYASNKPAGCLDTTNLLSPLWMSYADSFEPRVARIRTIDEPRTLDRGWLDRERLLIDNLESVFKGALAEKLRARLTFSPCF
jgi:hypothetical protein